LFVREVVEAQRQEGRILVERGVADLAGGDAAVAPPVSLAAAIESRLGSLPPRAVSLLRWAAVLGAEFAVVDLATVAGLRATEVVALAEQAVADGVLVESGLRLAFRHPLFQQALAHAGPVGEREGSYRRAGGSLAEAGAAGERGGGVLLGGGCPARPGERAGVRGRGRGGAGVRVVGAREARAGTGTGRGHAAARADGGAVGGAAARTVGRADSR